MYVRTLLFSLLLPFAFQGCTQAQPLAAGPFNGRTRARIPVEIRYNLILLKISINGSMPLLFILDTGVRNTLLIEPVLLSLLHLDTTDVAPALIRGLGSPMPIEAARFHNVAIRTGDCSIGMCADLPTMDLLVMPEGAISYGGMFGLPIAGIIGGEIFNRFVVRINYAESFIELIEPAAFSPPKGKWQALPLQLQGGKPYVEGTLIRPDSSEAKRTFLLDSGSSSAILYREHGAALPERTLPSVIGTGIGGAMTGLLCRFPALQLGTFALKQPVVGIPDSLDIAMLPQEAGYYGNLGAEVLSRFQVYFDYSRNRLYLKPNSTFRQSFSYSYSGLEIAHPTAGDPRLIVVHVRPHSPAEKAGLLPGDTLLYIQHLSVLNMDVQEAYARINPDPGRGVCLTVRRGGTREQRLCYRSEDEL